MEVAKTILEQLGGRRFMAMTGAKNLLAGNCSLSFQLPSRFAKDGINAVLIELTPADTYTVTFKKFFNSRTRGLVVNTVSEHTDVYCDTLQPLFTRETGLDTHL